MNDQKNILKQNNYILIILLDIYDNQIFVNLYFLPPFILKLIIDGFL